MKHNFIQNGFVKYIALLFFFMFILLYGRSICAISLTDYTFPESTSQQGYLNSTFNVTDRSDPNSQTGYDLTGSASYNRYFRSLPMSYNLNLLGNFNFNQGTDEEAESNDAYNLRLGTRLNKYLEDTSDVFGFGGANLEYRKLLDQDDADDPFLDITIGVGYGRSIDATVLKQAMRINEDLKKFNIINGDIPDKGMLELASVIDNEDEYRSKYGVVEYKKYWYEDMEKILRQNEILTHDALGAMGIVRIQEILDEPTGLRFYGWEVRAGLGLIISDFSGEEGDPLLSLEFDWARPVSTKLQLNNKAFARTVFTDDQTYTLSEQFQIYYEFSNKIDWDNTFRINYDILTAEDSENILNLNFNSTYILYIANQLTFNPGLNYSYLDDGVDDAKWNWALLGSISYRFL